MNQKLLRPSLKPAKSSSTTLTETSQLIRNLELGNWRNLPETDSPGFERAMNMEILVATVWYNRATPVQTNS
jgi:hypothetical protein